MARQPAFEKNDIFVSGENGYHTMRIPTMVISRNDVIIVFAEGRRKSSRDDGDIDLVARRSLDLGKRWEELQIVHSEKGDDIFFSNPCGIFPSGSDELVLLFCRNDSELFLAESGDEGKTFSAPKNITSVVREVNYPWVSFGTGPVHGIELREGRLVVPMYYSTRKNYEGGEFRSGALYSDDRGKTWQAGDVVGPEVKDANEATIYERADGSLTMNMRAERAGYRALARSTDKGHTWSTAALDRNLPCPSCQGSMLRLPSSAGKKRLLFSNLNPQRGSANPVNSRHGLFVRLSYDEGNTWPFAKCIESGLSGYSDMGIDSTGMIYIVYENGPATYHDRISVVKVNLEWLTDGKDGLEANS